MSATEVSLELALNDRDFIAVTDSTRLRYTYYVQPQFVKSINPTGGRIDGGTLVTVEGGGFVAYPGVNLSDVKFGWGDTEVTYSTQGRNILAYHYGPTGEGIAGKLNAYGKVILELAAVPPVGVARSRLAAG